MTIPTGSARLKRISAAVLAALGWFALILQYVLHVRNASAMGLSVLDANLRFFLYFTIECNILAALVLSAFAIKAKSDEWLVHPFVRTAVAVYIAVVGLVYGTVLRHLWAPQGAQWLADTLLHYVMPAGYLVFWFTCVRKSGLRWYDPLLWLIYPFAYLLAALLYGQGSGFYPYPFIDAGALGYAKTGWNALGVLVLFVTAGALAVISGRLLSRHAENRDVG